MQPQCSPTDSPSLRHLALHSYPLSPTHQAPQSTAANQTRHPTTPSPPLRLKKKPPHTQHAPTSSPVHPPSVPPSSPSTTNTPPSAHHNHNHKPAQQQHRPQREPVCLSDLDARHVKTSRFWQIAKVHTYIEGGKCKYRRIYLKGGRARERGIWDWDWD